MTIRLKLKKGDEVFVIAGKDKGKRGVISKVFSRDAKVLVDGLNFCKHFVRPNPDKGIRGGIETKEAPLPISNVMLFDVDRGKPTRVGFRILDDGRKIRVSKISGRLIDS